MGDTIPTDAFSRRRRELADNPGSLSARSTVDVTDFYGNTSTWVVETFRVNSIEEAFIQRSAADGALRLAVPSEVMAAMRRQQDGIDKRSRRRGAQQALETKRASGQTIGNPAALAKARRSRKKR